ncbi:MAG TPA: UrcA family protein [Steroidobacteraceae bacterium]|jgi:UrcA family protein|nr:UrcA family protein [Steroidobacteraceae bacterium]
MTRNTRKFSALLTAGLMTLGCIGVAQASIVDSADSVAPSRRVSYSDLNLDRSADAAQLYTRIERAARNVCRDQLGTRSPAQVVPQECLRQVIGEAVANVNNPNLAAIHAARSERSLIASTTRRRS